MAEDFGDDQTGKYQSFSTSMGSRTSILYCIRPLRFVRTCRRSRVSGHGMRLEPYKTIHFKKCSMLTACLVAGYCPDDCDGDEQGLRDDSHYYEGDVSNSLRCSVFINNSY